MSSSKAAEKAFVPGLPESGAPRLKLNGKMVTWPMAIATAAGGIFLSWAVDSLRWWITVLCGVAAVAVVLFIGVYFGNRAMRKGNDGRSEESK